MEQILKRTHLIIGLLSLSLTSFGQLPNKVGSLINADRTLEKLAEQTTPYDAFLDIYDKNSIVFSPHPIPALPYMKNRPNFPDIQSWEPNFAGISKSMEWGFTFGGIEFQRIGAPKRQGEYLNIWKRNRKGEWKIHLRAIAENYGKPTIEPNFVMVEPDSADYFKQRSQARLDQRKDVITNNDRLFATVLRSKNELAFQEFYAENVRVVIPWNEPLYGKNAAIGFFLNQKIDVQTNWLYSDRAYSGEIAATYGNAHLTQNGEVKRYYYIRIWQRQPDYQWRVILEFYTEE